MEKKRPALLRLWDMGQEYHSKLILAACLAVIGVICSMAAYYSAAQMVIGLLNNIRTIHYYLSWCCVALVGYTLRALLYNLALSKSHQATFAIMKDIRLRCVHKLANFPMGVLLNIPSGKFKQIIVDQVESVETPLAHLIPELTSNILGPVFVILYIFILDWRMALISLISLPVGLFFMSFMMKDYATKYEGSVKVGQHMNHTIVEYINGIEVIKAFNQGKNSYKKYQDAVIDNAAYYYNWMKSCQLASSSSRVVAPSNLITVLPIGLLFVYGQSLSVETFIMILILSFGIVDPLIQAMSFTDSLAKVSTIVETIEDILNRPEQIHASKDVQLDSMDIQLEHVSFSYDGKNEILHDISLTIEPNTKCAFVGPSGSGKSTITKLIAGFWDVEKGKISIDHHNLKEIPLTQLNDQIAYVSQENYLFDETIMENIRMGNKEASDEMVYEVCRQIGCDDFIQNLEHGYNTRCGSSGTHLSGGERQRIAIARAMLKDAPIIILDEASAYIDPENEAIVQKAVSTLVKGKTLIVVAHRLSTIVDADQIIVVDNGHIIAKGNHNNLLKESNLYHSMWAAHMELKEVC